jgi:multidrug resistance efflux pump
MKHDIDIERYESYFKTVQTLKPPRVLSVLAYVITFSVWLTLMILILTPWIQTSSGIGKVTALYPDDRLQTIHALVGGRLNKWYVGDGTAVKAGDPIVEVVDNDPNLLERLEGEQEATQRKVDAAIEARRTANLDYVRQKELLAKGLASRKDFESASIKLEEMKAKEADAVASLTKTQVNLSRQDIQIVRAPRDGTIVRTNAENLSTFVKQGDEVATFVPVEFKPAIELYVSGLDAPLIQKGRNARIIFEGWPAVQFSGWPSVAVGTFGGIVHVVDPALSSNGMIRVMITEDPKDPWPDARFMRYGTKARGWVLLNEVPLIYELWRRLNSFPPEFTGLDKPQKDPSKPLIDIKKKKK